MLPQPTAPDYQAGKPQILPTRIWKDHEPTDDKGGFREVEWVEYVKKGSNGATNIEKVARLKKNSVIWPVIEPYYEAWLKGQDDPVEGTPLDAWPGVTKGQVAQLRLLHLLSVEDVAICDENTLERIGMGARALRDKARAFVKAKEGESAMAEALTVRDEEIKRLSARVIEMEAAIASLSKGKTPRTKPKDAAGGE